MTAQSATSIGSAAVRARRARARSVRAALHFTVPLVVVWAIPLVALAVLVPAGGQREAASVAAPAVTGVRVGSRADGAAQNVIVQVTAAKARRVTVDRSGLVTAVRVQRGQALTAGRSLAVVDGVTVVAYPAAAPLYRDLSYGDSGPDVRAAARFLVAAGLLPPAEVGATYRGAMYRAAEALERSTGGKVDGVLHRDQLAWVPPSVRTAGAVRLAVGDRLASGDVIVSAATTPAAVAVKTGDGEQDPTVPEQPLRLTAGDRHVDIPSLALGEPDRRRVAEFLEDAVDRQTVTAATSGGRTTYSGVRLGVVDSREQGVVPSSAVYSTPDGSACVFRLEQGVKAAAVPIGAPRLLTGELGSVAVPAALIGRTVVRDPLSLPAAVQRACE